MINASSRLFPRARFVARAAFLAPALVLVSGAALADEAAKAASSEEEASSASEARSAQDQSPASDPEWENEKATRRSGLIVGIQANVGLAMASGYPLDLKKIGRASYYTQTDIGLGAMGMVWVGGSLKDWLSFGLGACLNGIVAGDKNGWGPCGVFRLEGFPLWPLGGLGKEIGVTFDAGASATVITQKDDDTTNLIDGGAASYLGGGVFYEGIRFWRVSTGPGLYAGYMWSDTVRQGLVTLDWRVTLYSGSSPPEKKKSASR